MACWISCSSVSETLIALRSSLSKTWSSLTLMVICLVSGLYAAPLGRSLSVMTGMDAMSGYAFRNGACGMRSPSVTGLPSAWPSRSRDREYSGICMSGSSYLHFASAPCSHPVAILTERASFPASAISFAVARARRMSRERAALSSCPAPTSPMNWKRVSGDGGMKSSSRLLAPVASLGALSDSLAMNALMSVTSLTGRARERRSAALRSVRAREWICSKRSLR